MFNFDSKQGRSLSVWMLAKIALIGFVLFTSMSTFSAQPTLARPQDSPVLMANVGIDVQAESRQQTDCTKVAEPSEQECNLLVLLYRQTNGEQWRNQENWLDSNDRITPCDWYGVTCINQQVTELNLAGNRLQGELPSSIVRFPALTHLVLNDNQLTGAIPIGICDVADRLEKIDLTYNQLTATNRRAKACLEQASPEWLATQTIPPFNLRPTAISTNTVALAWGSIPNDSAGAYYEVSYAASMEEPFTIHGLTEDTQRSAYRLTGLTPGESYVIRVRTYTPANDQQLEEQWSAYATIPVATETDEEDVLLLVYFPADNDLSPYVNSVTRRLQIGSALNPSARVLLLTDGAEDGDTKILEIADGSVTESTAIERTWGSNELNTMDASVLAWFLTNGRGLYPASRTIVSIMGHGVGLTPEFQWLVSESPGAVPEPQADIPPLPRGMDYTPGDIADNGGFLSTMDLAEALSAATDDGANPFDLIFFDQCFQGNLDVLYEMRNTADVFIGSGNYAWLSAPYHQYLPFLTPSKTPETMARSIIRIYQNSLNEHHPNAIFWTKSSDIETVAEAVSNLGTALLEATNSGQDELILQASVNGKYVDTTQCGRQNLVLGPPDELVGAGSFAQNLLRLFPNDSAVAASASQVVASLEAIEGNAQIGRPYIAPQTIWNFDDTFTILAPLRRDAPASLAWRASIYTEETDLTAKWTALPTQTVSITNTFAFVRDMQWDEFLDTWYTTELEPTVGDWCHYTPPIIVSDVVTESLALTAEMGRSGIELAWEETSQDEAVEYWVMARQADGNWRTLTVVDLAQRVHTIVPRQAEQIYAFMVVAQSELGIAVAQSNEANFVLDDPTRDNELFLPLISVE